VIPVELALERLLAPLQPVSTELVPLTEAFGRVLAEDVVARLTQPPAAISSRDGYALRAADTTNAPVRLQIIGSVPAGSGFDGALGPGQAVRIFTGAPLPSGADCVVMQEDAERDGDRVGIRETIPPEAHVLPAGLDFRAGEIGLAAGRILTARDIGLAAAMNRPWLTVRRRPRIAILPTGDEIAMPGDPLGPHQIVSSNGFALGALVTACGGTPLQLGIARDDEAALRDRAAAALGCDLLVTTGGASVGEHDLVRSALADDGFQLDFWQVAMRPGKPLMVGQYRGLRMLGLPGSPVSAVVCGLVFLKPAIDRLLGLETRTEPLQARCTLALKPNDRRQSYLRAESRPGSDGILEVTPFLQQDSSMLALLSRATCLVIRPPQAPALAAGERVPILPFTDTRPGF
jgi:molybdopterin molybdotransferase